MAGDLIVVKVDRARALLAEARDAGDAKKVADLARAAEVYARRQKLSEEAIQYAHAVKVDAMTLMGDFLKNAEKNTGTAGNGRPKKGGDKKELPKAGPPTLAEVGIGKKESSDAQTLATIKETAPELHDNVRNGKVRVSQARVALQREEKKRDLEKKAATAEARIAEQKEAGDLPWRIVNGDCIGELSRVKAGSVRLVFADPPYNIGIDYGEGTKADKLPDAEYLQWCETWLLACKRVLTEDGSLWVLIGDEYAAEYGVMLKRLGFTLRAWIKWYETFGVNQANNFNRCSRHLFYCVVNPRKFMFHPAAVNRPSDRQTKYGDSRADPAGKIWDDVWVIPRLVGTAKERIPEFPTQLPLALLMPIIGCTTDPGDLVIDPFSGSGSAGAAAIQLGRRFLGIEKSERFSGLARKRLLSLSTE